MRERNEATGRHEFDSDCPVVLVLMDENILFSLKRIGYGPRRVAAVTVDRS
jgi:hypothetical protein